jgi:hypothetical protein
MFAKKWIAVLATAVSLFAANVGTSAFASTSHWSNSQCASWVNSWHKRHPHSTKSQRKPARKVLKAHGCPRSYFPRAR